MVLGRKKLFPGSIFLARWGGGFGHKMVVTSLGKEAKDRNQSSTGPLDLRG